MSVRRAHSGALLDAGAAQRRWSPVNQQFLEFATRQQSNAMGTQDAPTASVLQTPLGYAMQRWPLFIDAARYAEIGRVAVAVDHLMKSLVPRFFGRDTERIAAYFAAAPTVIEAPVAGSGHLFHIELTPELLELLLEEPNGIAAAPSRGDYLDTTDGLRFLEFNAGGALGGIPAAQFAPGLMREEPTATFLAEYALRVRPDRPIDGLLRHIIQETRRQGIWRDGEFRLAVLLYPSDENNVPLHPRDFYEESLRHAVHELGGTEAMVVICRDTDFLEREGTLEVGGQRVHAVLEQHGGGADIRRPFRIFKRGGVSLFSGPIAALLSDKRMLALASTHADTGEFTSAERHLIHSHIPWTCCVRPEAHLFRGRPFRVPDDLLDAREQFVLKKATSFGGEHVLIGRATTTARWISTVALALREGDWVLQEHVESACYRFHSDRHAAGAPYEVVWGLYAFGGTFGGVYLRMQQRELTESVINRAKGAEVGQLLVVSP